VFEIRQLLVGDILLSPEYWKASYWEFLFSGFDCGTLDNLKEEPRSVLQDGRRGNGVAAELCVCVMGSKRIKFWRHDTAYGVMQLMYYAVACPLSHGFCALGELGRVSPTLKPASQ